MHTVLPRLWPLRALQLDLARQMETLEAIRDYIAFAKDWGYNTLFLYLEGVIRTESFPHRSSAHSYSPEDIAAILAMAAEAGLEVIPCVATLGHAEHFLNCEAVSHLEEADCPFDDMMCPSSEPAYQFLEAYLTEVAALFPGKHFHIGCDESWGLGSCPACLERSRRGESPEDFMVAHILRMQKILTALGKRVWIWDDMFESDFADTIARLPRDIVLCTWHYWPDNIDRDGFRGHFNNLLRNQPIPHYRELGFDVVVCPWVKGYHSPIRLTEITREHDVLGGIQTMWELCHSFLPGILPAAAITGALWSNPADDPETVIETALSRLFPQASAELRLAVRAATTERFWFASPPEEMLRGLITQEELRNLDSLKLAVLVLERGIDQQDSPLAQSILRELASITRLQIAVGTQREILPHLVDPRLSSGDRDRLLQRLERQVAEMARLAEERTADWNRLRPGITPERAGANLDIQHQKLAAFAQHWQNPLPQNRALLTLRLSVPDAYAAPTLTVSFRCEGAWTKIYEGCCRPFNLRDGLYTLQVPCEFDHPPELVRLTVSKFGCQGITFFSLATSQATYVPQAIAAQSGTVSHPLALLIDNSFATYLGGPDAALTLARGRGNDSSSLDVLIREKAH